MDGAPACYRALADASERWPSRRVTYDGVVGDEHHKARASDHNQGNAVDVTHDPESGCDGAVISSLAIKDARVTYVIWDHRIYNRARASEGWRAYPGPDPHTTHCHVSIRPSLRADSSPWGWAPAGAAPSSAGGYAWTTSPAGYVEVDLGAGYVRPVADAPLADVLRWTALAERHTRSTYELAAVLGTMHVESRGNPSAVSEAGAVGLMQLLPSTAKLPSSALLEPELNVAAGAKLLRGYLARWDLPTAVSLYNAGGTRGGPHVSPSSPWRMREQPGHILKVVRAHNTYLHHLDRPGGGGAGALVIGAVALAAYTYARRR